MYITALTGAGVSSFSGLPTFTGTNGIYNDRLPESFSKKDMIDAIPHNCKPSIIHNRLADLYVKNELQSIITQNIDGLHQKSGVDNVIELHGDFNNIIMYGDLLDEIVLKNAQTEILKADVLLILGTALKTSIPYELAILASHSCSTIIIANENILHTELAYNGNPSCNWHHFYKLEDFDDMIAENNDSLIKMITKMNKG